MDFRLLVLAICLSIVASAGITALIINNNQDTIEPIIWIDDGTGCQYLMNPAGGRPAPRVDGEDRHVGCVITSYQSTFPE